MFREYFLKMDDVHEIEVDVRDSDSDNKPEDIFKIELNNFDDDFVYVAGNAIEGTVVLKFSDDNQTMDKPYIYRLLVKVSGKLKFPSSQITPEITQEIDIIPYFPGIVVRDQNQTATPSGDTGTDDIILSVGEHNVKFVIQLPDKLISSFTSSNISVNYIVKAEILHIKTNNIIFTANHDIQLRDRYPLLDEPAELKVSNITRDPGFLRCLFPCMLPKIECKIARERVNPYDKIPIKIKANITSYCCVPPITDITVTFVQEIRHGEKVFKSDLVFTTFKGEDLQDSDFYQSGISIKIPDCPPTGDYSVYNLNISYYIAVHFDVNCIRSNKINIILPVSVGNFLQENQNIDVPY